MQRPETQHESDKTLVRIATCIDGEVEVALDCRPSFEYGSQPASWEPAPDGELKASGGSQSVNLATDIEPSIDGERVVGQLTLQEGQSCYAAVCWDEEGGAPRSAPEAQERVVATSDFWRAWLRHGSFPDHPWRVHLQRSAVVLKGLTYAPTGALLAAPTTSLPETPGGERNWDYRYSWIRDSTFSLWALHTLGFDEEAAGVRPVHRRARARPRGTSCRSCTGSAASATSPSAPSTTSPATAGRARCGSATAPSRSARTTSGGRCWTRSTSTRRRSTTSATRTGS